MDPPGQRRAGALNASPGWQVFSAVEESNPGRLSTHRRDGRCFQRLKNPTRARSLERHLEVAEGPQSLLDGPLFFFSVDVSRLLFSTV